MLARTLSASNDRFYGSGAVCYRFTKTAISTKNLMLTKVPMKGAINRIDKRLDESFYQQDYRRHAVQVKPLMEALVSSPGFAALPGPVRVAAVDIFVSDMARSLVWGSVGRSVAIEIDIAASAGQLQLKSSALTGAC